MPIFQLTRDTLQRIPETSFGTEGIFERRDLQRLLREQISVLGENLLVISEEFGGWLDSSRRIDLLCLDKEANPVVIELKRSDDGGHMELQALRYAAMISEMTFEQLVRIFAEYRSKAQIDLEKAKSLILEFLEWDEISEDEFHSETRIILASADFGKELTTTVIWLRDHYGVNVKCIRMKPYRMENGSILLDVQQLIPLPEAEEFQTKIGEKRQAERQSLSDRFDFRIRFWEQLLAHAKLKTNLHANRNPTRDNWISGSIGRTGLSLIYSIREKDSQVELWIGFGSGQTARNKAAFKSLEMDKVAIETEFGDRLGWQELPEREGCRIRYAIEGGYRSPEEQWPAIHAALVDAMVKLDLVMRKRVNELAV